MVKKINCAVFISGRGSNLKSIYKYSGIDVYEYPLNEYCECYTSLWNFHNKPFKEYINNDVDFSGKYPVEKNPPKIIFKPKQAKGGK